MGEFFRQLASGIAQTWRRLSISARVQLALAAIITIAIVAGAALFGAQPQYGLLFRNLPADESSQITVWLTEQDIPYRLREGGTAIDVPARDISRARLGLAAQNLPTSQGAVAGFELFDQRDLMSNRYLQDVDYMRALHGTLQRQLNQFDYVVDSSVFIREAEDNLFVGEQKPSQATVLLKTNGPLAPDQVKAILQTVDSFGGANLGPRNIAIMTTDGQMLHSMSEDEAASLANDKLGVKVAYEREAERKIREAFEKMGQKIVVSVAAIIDWTSEEVTDKKLAEGVDVATMEQKEEVRDANAVPAGPPGALANIPEEPALPDRENFITKSSETIVNSEPSEVLRKKSVPAGLLKQYRVAAFIDPGSETVNGADGQPVLAANGQPQTQARQFTPQQIAQFQSFIQNALGASEEVETDVTVAALAFGLGDTEAVSAPQLAAGTPWMESDWFAWTWQIGLVAFVFLMVRFLMRRALVLPAAEEEEVIEIPEASPAERRAQEIAAEVERLSQQEPDTVAALLRTWMSQE